MRLAQVEFVAGRAVVHANRGHGLGAVTVKIAGKHDTCCLSHDTSVQRHTSDRLLARMQAQVPVGVQRGRRRRHRHVTAVEWLTCVAGAISPGLSALGTVGVMAQNDREMTRLFHDATKHTVESVRGGGHFLDVANMPLPLKYYPDLEPIPLPVDLPERDGPAVEVLSGRVDAAPGPWGLPALARALFFSAGVTRRARLVGGRPIFLRAAASAGGLYPIEVYVVCGDLPGLPAGVYHFNPVEFALRRLRTGDHRPFLARAAADGAIEGAPTTLVLTGIPWRTTWKYGERGYRHLFWDSGAVVANMLAIAEAAGVTSRVLTGFVDDDVSHLLGIGSPEEYPLVIVPLAGGPRGRRPAVADRPPAIDHRVHPLSAFPQHHTGLAAVHRAGVLTDSDEVTGWRTAAAEVGTVVTGEVPVSPGGRGTLEDVIVRRGSTRRYAREPVGEDVLRWELAVAARPVPADFAGPGRTLLEHFVAVHAVEGVAPGIYRWVRGNLEQIERGTFHHQAAHLCLDQPLGGDCAFDAFHCAALGMVIERSGARGYRSGLLEAGTAMGRLQLAAYAHADGASGITFYDDEVSAFLQTEASPMLVTTVGVPDYRPRPGKRPADMDRLRVQLT
jgi:SagB-type dehydrogenase family enzyme